jgi:hypothetical protein
VSYLFDETNEGEGRLGWKAFEGLPGDIATMVHRPRPVELGADGLTECVDILYALVRSVILAGFNDKDGLCRIFCEASCDSDAGEATTDDYIVKSLRSGIPRITRYAVCCMVREWLLGGVGGEDKCVCGKEKGGGDDDETEAHRSDGKRRCGWGQPATLRLWDCRRNKCRRTIDGSNGLPPSPSPSSATYSPAQVSGTSSQPLRPSLNHPHGLAPLDKAGVSHWIIACDFHSRAHTYSKDSPTPPHKNNGTVQTW